MDYLEIEGVGEVKSYQSQTKNGGRTVILPGVAAATAIGQAYVDEATGKAQQWVKEKRKIKVTLTDGAKQTTKTWSAVKYWEAWKNTAQNFELACEELKTGIPAISQQVEKLCAELFQMALDLEPSINTGYQGFRRAEDGDEVLPDLLREHDDRPFLTRRRGSQEPRPGRGDGAYRIIINTDVQWGGDPADNCGLAGALVMLLQMHGPVEIWIQQGWLGTNEGDGVTLFKLDFTGGFDPTQLSFWVGSAWKDSPYSFTISRALERQNMGVNKVPEVPCDLWISGTLPAVIDASGKSVPFDQTAFNHATKEEKKQMLAAWLAATASHILCGEAMEVA